ncbi:hypothetical protein HF086_017236, partial [Spodoptera exigua]
MGTPIHTWQTNAETKLYRLQSPATPLFRSTHYDNIGLDDYPCGTNAIVAVISYTVVSRYHGKEEVFVDSVRLCGDFSSRPLKKACVMLRLQVHDATPFRFNEKDTAINYFGRLLEASGYNYYGTERMYSGVDGREMDADIFFGVIHYQRLRHMVSDKWQPVKGRRRGGGVRLGEMERDALASHGASFLLHDRLFHCSDKTE